MNHKPDLTYFISSHPLNNIGIILIKIFNKINNHKIMVLSHIHDPIPHSDTKYRFFIYLSQLVQIWLSDKICVFGKKLGNFLSSHYKVPKENILYIRHGAYRISDKTCLYSGYEKSDFIYVSLLGRIDKYKGVDIFLKAAKRALDIIDNQKINVVFLIGGEGNLSEYYDLLHEIPLKNLDIRNYLLSNSEFDEILKRSYCCVLPYKDASQTGNIQIAYYNACPVIATNTGSLDELVVDGETGFIIPVNDIESLAHRIVYFIKNPEQRLSFGARALKFYKENLTWETIISDFILKIERWRALER